MWPTNAFSGLDRGLNPVLSEPALLCPFFKPVLLGRRVQRRTGVTHFRSKILRFLPLCKHSGRHFKCDLSQQCPPKPDLANIWAGFWATQAPPQGQPADVDHFRETFSNGSRTTGGQKKPQAGIVKPMLNFSPVLVARLPFIIWTNCALQSLTGAQTRSARS